MLEAVPLAPIWSGLVIFGLLTAGLLGMELAVGNWPLLMGPESDARLVADVRLASVLNMLLANGPIGTLYLTRQARRTLLAVTPVVDLSPAEASALHTEAGLYSRRWLLVGGVLGVAVVSVLPFAVMPIGVLLSPARWSPEITWQLVVIPFVGWWGGRNVIMQSMESRRLSSLASRLERIDLFDLSPLEAFSQQGLLHVLLSASTLAILSPMLIDLVTVPIFFSVATISATAGISTLVVCLRGVRTRVRATKHDELRRIRAELARLLAEGPITTDREKLARVADLLAYQAQILSVGEWTLESSRLGQLVLYLLLPLGSWLGAVMVKRMLGMMLT